MPSLGNESSTHLRRRIQSALARENWPAALGGLTKLIATAPADASLHYNRALVRKRLGDLPGAVSDLETALGIEPGHDKACFELATARLDLGRLSDAERDLMAYLKRVPNDVDALLNLGRLLLRRGVPAAARKHLRQATALGGGPPAALALAEAERDCGAVDACMAILSRLDDADPAVAAARLKVATQGPNGRIRLDATQFWRPPR